MIKVQDISFSHRNKNVDNPFKTLNKISFSIKKGEFVSMLGKSGCGKTTLVNILAGYLKPDSGSVFLGNKKLNHPGKNRILVNQESDLFYWMSVYKNMEFVNSNKKDIKKYLKLVGLDQVTNYYPNQLSGGMKKRLSLARALVVNPSFLILDEPFASLDHKTTEDLHISLDEIFTTTKKTTLLVTHDIEEAVFLSDRVIILGNNPTKVIRELPIKFSHPRNIDIKDSKKFANYCKRIKSSY